MDVYASGVNDCVLVYVCVYGVWMCRETKLCFRCEYRSKTDVAEYLFSNVMRVQNRFCL